MRINEEGNALNDAADLSKPEDTVVKKPKKKKPAAKKKAAAKKTTARRKPANRRGRPLMFPDKTIVRMPAGWLKAINAKAKAKDLSQGDYMREMVKRAIGK